MKEMEKVTVVGDENGNFITISKNPEFGYVKIRQVVPSIDANGWLRKSLRTFLIKGTVKDLLDMGYKPNQTVPGKLIAIESFEPFDNENPDRDLKIAGDSGVICRVDDRPIYRRVFYTLNENAQDELIQHTNTDEIREANAANRLLSKIHEDELNRAITL